VALLKRDMRGCSLSNRRRFPRAQARGPLVLLRFGNVSSILLNIMNPRITTNPAIMGGKPCIRGTRVTVGTIQRMLSDGMTRERILELYPYLSADDLDAAHAEPPRAESKQATQPHGRMQVPPS